MASVRATESTPPNPALTKPFFLFSCWAIFLLFLFIKPLASLVRLSFSQDDASHLILVPFISAAILYLERYKIFSLISPNKILGGALLFLGGLVALASYLAKNVPSRGLQLSGWILALVLFWASGFAFLFGRKALRAAQFPFLFLLLMVPIPNLLLDQIIRLLQEGSAWITGVLFDLLGIPVLREGLVFRLAKLSIEVAKECSGIRSSIALFILALLVAHFRLRSFWSKTFFVAFGLFLMILKNGVRIATLTLLAVYVNPDFLFGRLHQQGGVVFFVLALLLLWPLLSLLQRSEAKKGPVAEPS